MISKALEAAILQLQASAGGNTTLIPPFPSSSDDQGAIA
jgi:hypothetical protein